MITEDDIKNAQYENQFTVQGNDPVFPQEPDPDIVVFISFLEGVNDVRILDRSGRQITGILQRNDPVLFYPPLRVDGGVQFDGNLRLAHGFFIQK